jgi:hypothetical protein
MLKELSCKEIKNVANIVQDYQKYFFKAYNYVSFIYHSQDR